MPDDGQPLVSIGMPIYNEERFLDRALESLRRQDYSNIEILISDNASTDATGEIARRFAEEDPRIRYQSTGENIGVAANFRRVQEQARGKYFMWAAGHDEWSEDLVSQSVAALEQNRNAAIAFATSFWIDEAGERDEQRDTHYPDTRGKGVFSRFFTVLWGNMHPVLGLIRTEYLGQTSSVQNFAGADLALLSELILMGDFVHAPNAWWNRRDVRERETHGERMKRYTGKEYGQATGSLDKRFPLLRLPFALIRAVWHARVPLLQRIAILLVLIPVMPFRYVAGRRKAANA